MTRLGFIGLGIMGHAMARNLIAGGHTVTVWNRTVEKTEGVDAEVAPDPAGVGASSDIAFVCVSDTPDAGILSSRSTSSEVSFISAPCLTSADFVWTDASVALSFGRFSARPDANLSHASFACTSCSRASRSSGWMRTRSALSASALTCRCRTC